MDDIKLRISPRYYIAEAAVWLLGAILLVSRFVGLAPSQPLPLLNVTLGTQQHFSRVVAVLLAAATTYLILEWKQSSRESRRSYWSQSRAGLTILFSCASFWLCYSLIAANTIFAGLSPAWYFGFCVIGFLLGSFVSTLVIASLMIRTPTEVRTIHLHRIPVATRAQYKLGVPVVFILLAMYYILCYTAPDAIKGLDFYLLGTPFVLTIGTRFLSLCLKQDEDGKRIPFAKRIEALKKVFDSHDYSYYLIGHGSKFADQMGITTKTSPETTQKAMQERFSVESTSGTIHFHVQLQEKVQFKFHSKDGDQNNTAPENRGVKIEKHQGKEDFLRVLVILDEPENQSREMEIQTGLVQKNAEEYLAAHTEEVDLTSQKVFSYAIDQTVIQTMTQQAEPLLQRAVFAGQKFVVEELLKQDIDVNERAPADWTALLCAAAQGYPRIVRLLLDAGANPDMGNLHGITPLMYGARYKNIEICRILLESGANSDLQDIYGMTALMNATCFGSVDIADMLLKAGADINIKDRKGITALDIAHKSQQGKIARMIRTSSQRIKAKK